MNLQKPDPLSSIPDADLIEKFLQKMFYCQKTKSQIRTAIVKWENYRLYGQYEDEIK